MTLTVIVQPKRIEAQIKKWFSYKKKLVFVDVD